MSDNETIVSLLKDSGMSLSEFARRTGISRAHVHNIVNKGQSITIDKLHRIAIVFGVSTSELTGELVDIDTFCKQKNIQGSIREFALNEDDITWRDIIMMQNLYDAGCTIDNHHNWRVLWLVIKGLLA